VERGHDGDTIRCKGGISVRLLLIDAPELSQRPFGDQSRRALTRMVPVGARVTLETDREPRDRYGRLLAYVYDADGRMANAEMARAGYAVPLMYAPNGRYRAEVEAAASDAAAARRGLHATGGFACAPREHRRKRC
jgi:micrococcal nuclease